MKNRIRRVIAGMLASVMFAAFGSAGGTTAMADEVSGDSEYLQSIEEKSEDEENSDSLKYEDTDKGTYENTSDETDLQNMDSSAEVPTENAKGKEVSVEYETENESNSQEGTNPALFYDEDIVEESSEEILFAGSDPNFTQGGAGSRVDVTGQVVLRSTQRARYNYDDAGRGYGSFFTIASNMVLEDGSVAGWSVCVDPKKNGFYTGTGASFKKIYRFDAPLLKKAMYYADGTGHNYAAEVYAGSHGGKVDDGGVNILMHTSVSEIYARLGWAYKSQSGDYRDGASSLLISDVSRYVALLNTLPDAPGDYYIYVGVNPDDFYQDFAFLSKRLEKGSLSLKKKGSGDKITDGNDFYSIEGAVYSVYSDSSLSKEVGSFMTDKHGETNKIENLTAGTYYVKETKAPRGYQLDTEVHAVNVKAGENATISVEDVPLVDDVLISIQKSSSGESIKGGLTTAGTLFTVEHYPEKYESVEKIPEDASHRTWKIVAKEDEEGIFAKLDVDHLQDGSDDLYMYNGNVVLPYGTLVIREEKAAKGFLNDGSFTNSEFGEKELGEVFLGTLQGEEKIELFCKNTKISESGFSIADTPIYGGVKIRKLDYETQSAMPQGDATLKGAEIALINQNDYNVLYDGQVIEPGETVCTLETDEDGNAGTGERDLAYGSYLIREVKAPKGYTEIGVTERKLVVQEDGLVVDMTAPEEAILNRVIRGDILFRKIEASSQKSLAGIQFTITLIRTGEKHTIKVDENGEFDSKHSDLWFGDGEKNPDVGALLYGEYMLEEVPTKENANYQMYRGSFTVSRDFQVIDLHNIENRDKPDLGTELTDEEGNHEVMVGKEITLTDTVAYYNFDQYIGKTVTFHGTLMDQNTGKPILVNGKEVTAQKTETIKSVNGQVKMTFTLDASALEKKSVVAFENAYDREGILIVSHTNIHDGAQTVKFQEKPQPEVPHRGVKTGDSSNAFLWSILLLAAGLTLGAALIGMQASKDHQKKPDSSPEHTAHRLK